MSNLQLSHKASGASKPSSESTVEDLENELRQVQGKILLLECSIHNLRKKNHELKTICERQAAEIRVLKLQNLKGKICDEIEMHSGELIEAKLVKAYEKIESERVSLTKKNQEEVETLKGKLQKLKEEKLLISADYLKSQVDLDALKRERDDILRDILIQKNRNNALRIRNEKNKKELLNKRDELLRKLSTL